MDNPCDSELPIYRFGCIADTQYADSENTTNFFGDIVRRHRHSLEILERACAFFDAQGIRDVIHLGDIVDGVCAANHSGERAMQTVLSIPLSHPHQTWYYCDGNHDFYSLSRERFYELLLADHKDIMLKDSCRPDKLYYEFHPAVGICCIVLDPYDVSTIAPSSQSHYDEAIRILKQHNPKVLAPGSGNWLAGIDPSLHRFVPYNGAVGQAQLSWLKETLEASSRNGDICLVFCHVPISKDSTPESALLWNHDEVHDMLASFPHVAAFISGHAHEGGISRCTSTGLHHIIPPAPIETPEGQNAFGIISVYQTHLKIDWIGDDPMYGQTETWSEKLPLDLTTSLKPLQAPKESS